MLAIRMQRTGRKGYATYRMVVQDSRQTPTSGKLVAQIGTYNPHDKTAVLSKEKAEFYLKNGARPSPRVARLLKSEGVALPSWVVAEEEKQRIIRNPTKLRSNQPAKEEPVEEPSAELPTEVPAEPEITTEVAEAPADEVSESEVPAEEPAAEEPVAAEEVAAEETDKTEA